MNRLLFHRVVLLASIITTLSFPIYAENDAVNNHKKWFSEVREYKQEFLTKEMNLTKEQQQAFFPLYKEMEQEVFKINMEAREMEKKVSCDASASDLEYEKAAQAMQEVKGNEAKVEAIYFDKFSKILSSKQLFQLKRAENRFTRSMLQHHKKRTN